jgi:NAD(P)-dependent dehydrogenase (short-subunit alcohol dehydrogenase family)
LCRGGRGTRGSERRHRHSDRAATIRDPHRQPGDGLQARALDVTDEGAVARLIKEIHTDHGGVDVLVNNAGFGSSSPLEQVVLSDLRSIFETNVVAMLHLSQAELQRRSSLRPSGPKFGSSVCASC